MKKNNFVRVFAGLSKKRRNKTKLVTLIKVTDHTSILI